MDWIWKDVRFGLRMLARRPGFTLVAALTVALGVGANTAVFTFVNAVLLRRLPVREPAELVGLYRKIPEDPSYNRFSYPNYLDVRDRNQVFADMAAYVFTPLSLSGAGQTERIMGKVATANYFSALGVPMALGRGFAGDEDRVPGASPVAVVSHGLWQRRFGSDPSLVGRTVNINGLPFAIVGVAPREFQGTEIGQAPEVWVPIGMQAQAMPGYSWLEPRGTGWLRVIGRLAPGVSVPQARAEMETLGRQLRQEHPAENEAFGIAVVSSFGLHPQVRGEVRTFVLIVMGVVGTVLLIACTNIASLLLSRATERRREIGVRQALGAGRARLVGQLLTESVLLAATGGALGLILAPWMVAGLNSLQDDSPLPTRAAVGLDGRVLLFGLLATGVTGFLFGLAPALRASRADLAALIKEGPAGAPPDRSRLRHVLVAAQTALALVLLVAGGLFLRSLQNAQRIEPGFDTDRQLMMSFDLGLQGYSPEKGALFLQQLEERVKSLPGVESVALAAFAPLTTDTDTTVTIEGYTPPTGQPGVVINFNIVGLDYFRTLGIPLVAGRDFAAGDGPDGPGVVILNETAARRFWPGQDPIGQRVGWGGSGSSQVVGVSRDSKYVTMGEEPRPYLYMTLRQNQQPSVTLHVRTAADPADLVASVRSEVRALDEDLPVYGVATMDEHMGRALAGPRVAATLLGTFGGLALLLAAVGIYGLMSYTVSQRTGEIGIRMALGARRGDILKMVLRQGSLPVAAGMIAGLLLAAAAARLLAAFLYGVGAADPVTFAATPAILAAVGLAACLLPALRATRIDPLAALRYE